MTSLPAVVPPAGTANPDSWWDLAICRGEDQDIWFPPEKVNAHEAKAICATCPVAEQCLEYALAENIKYGVWGGKSVNDRRRIREQRFRADRAVRDAGATALPLSSRTAHP